MTKPKHTAPVRGLALALGLGAAFASGYGARTAGLGERWWPAPLEQPRIEGTRGQGGQGGLPWATGPAALPGDATIGSADMNDSSEHGIAHAPTVGQLLSTITALLAKGHADDAGHEGRLNAQLEALGQAVHQTPAARQAVLQAFVRQAGTPLADALATVLGGVRDPAVEAAALRLAQAGGTPEQRLSGMDLLAQLPEQDAATRASLLGMLRAAGTHDAPGDVAILSALRRRGAVSIEAQDEVLQTIRPLAAGADSRVREEALRLMADWAPRDAAVGQALIQAMQDATPAVRIAAIQALADAPSHTAASRDAILARMSDASESPQVRLAASHALENFELDAPSLAAYRQFRDTSPDHAD